MIWPFTKIAELQRQVRALHVVLDANANRIGQITDELNLMYVRADFDAERDKRRLAEIDRLSKELAKARKNDTAKDAKTGKFTKKSKDV